MRITLKPVNGGTTSNQAVASKVSGLSFLDMLAQASCSTANTSAVAGTAQRDSSSGTPDHDNEDQTSGQSIAASENGADGAQEISTIGNSIHSSAVVIGGKQSQDAIPSQTASSIGSKASSTPSQAQSKASQPAEKQGTGSIKQVDDQSAAQQLVVSLPAVSLPTVSMGRSMQNVAASPDLSTFATVLPSKGNLASSSDSQTQPTTSQPAQKQVASPIMQAGDQGAARQRVVSMPAASLSEASIGSAMQSETVSSDLPIVASVPRSNGSLTPSLPLSTGSQPTEAQVTSSTQPAGDQGPAEQLVASMPAVSLPEASFGRSAHGDAASSDSAATASVLRSNGSLASSTSSLPQSTASQPAEKQDTSSLQQACDQNAAQQLDADMPVASQSEAFTGRTIQFDAASPDQQTFATFLRSNANSVDQTGSDPADASQSSLPTLASPATTDLSQATAAELIGQSAFAVGSAFSQSPIVSMGDAKGALTDKTAQFKSSGATFTASSGDTNSSKASPAQGSISAAHSTQNGTPQLQQHAVGDSSAATPIAIKPLDATATQSVPVSNHSASVSTGQSHAASSTTAVPIKAQDLADAAAEPLERTGSAAAAGINSARLIQTMSESEMRVGMHSAEFGDISIRTSVSQQQLTAQISVDHSELGSAISAHLPSLQSKLGSEFGLHASIDVNQLGGSVTGGNGQSSPHQNHKMTSQSAPLDSPALNTESDQLSLPGQLLDVEGSRLDIRA